jgi:hypothetical protein
MSANIYNDSNPPATSNILDSLVVKNLIAENAAIDNLNVDQSAVFENMKINTITDNAILVGKTSGIEGLSPGVNHDVLVSDGTQPVWTNSLNINTLTVNDITVPGTFNGDLIVFNSSQTIQRLGIGPSGTFLISDGTNPTWNALPNPITLGTVIVNENLFLTSFPDRTLITNGIGQVVSERQKFRSGGATLTTTPTQIYGVVEWNFTQNAWYAVKIQINNNAGGAFSGQIIINGFLVGHCRTQTLDTWYCEFTYNHTGSTGIYGIELANFISESVSTYTYSIKVERSVTPTF